MLRFADRPIALVRAIAPQEVSEWRANKADALNAALGQTQTCES